jgi:predicted NBD/HSP70 family sugar kinase
MFSPPQRQLLRALSEHGPRSRTELAAMMRMSKAAVTGFTRGLLDSGLLLETETVYGMGRPAIRLGLDPRCACFLGVSLAQDPVPLVLADLAGHPLAQHRIAWSREPAAIARGIAEGLRHLLGRRPELRDTLRGIGIALPGFVDQRQLVCIQSTILGWQGIPLAATVQAETGLPTAIENDANALALGERLFGAARGRTAFSMISLGEGIGCAHVVDGRLQRGHDGGAGEIAHCTIEPGGARCGCGKRGCLDTIAALPAILRAAREAGLAGGDVDGIEALARRGDAAASDILRRAGGALGLAIAHLIQINNPARIVVTRIAGSHDEGAGEGLFMQSMRETIAENILPRFRILTEIVLQQVTADIWARGAASIAAHRFLAPPEDAVADDVPANHGDAI